MSGRLGTDFNPLEPADDDYVKYGALWIRDIKARLKLSMSVLFNLDSGDLKDNVVRWQALRSLSPDPSGTWREVTVNEKGLVTAGSNASSAVLSMRPYRLVFGGVAAPVFYDDNAGVKQIVPVSHLWAGSGVYNGTYSGSWNYRSCSFKVPEGVTRIKCYLVGGGGHGYISDATHVRSGAGAEHVEGILPVTPGANLELIVGQGGGFGAYNSMAGAKGFEGGVTRVATGSAYFEAGGGKSGDSAVPGVCMTGAHSSNVLAISFKGQPGTTTISAPNGVKYSGTYLRGDLSDGGYGDSGSIGWTGATFTDAINAQPGLIILEWYA